MNTPIGLLRLYEVGYGTCAVRVGILNNFVEQNYGFRFKADY